MTRPDTPSASPVKPEPSAVVERLRLVPSTFGASVVIPLPAGCDMIVVFADLHQHVPVWIGLPHQLYVHTARRLLKEHAARSLTIVPYRNADKVELTATALASLSEAMERNNVR